MKNSPLLRKVSVVVTGSRFRRYNCDIDALDLSGDLGPAIEACRDEFVNFRAAELARQINRGAALNACVAVYVIGPEDLDVEICKIGTATSPLTRLGDLQIGNWHKLTIHSLLWMDKNAAAVEALSHRAAKEMEISHRGEWVRTTPKEACEIVLKAARYDGSPAFDSATWINNFASRTAKVATGKLLAWNPRHAR